MMGDEAELFTERVVFAIILTINKMMKVTRTL